MPRSCLVLTIAGALLAAPAAAGQDDIVADQGPEMKLPDCSFYLFGMGDRRKLLYKQGALLDALTGRVVRAPCHPERSEGSPRGAKPRYLASLGMTDAATQPLLWA